MTQIVTIYEGEDACIQCLGWKRVDNGEHAQSWKYWAGLPEQSKFAIRTGLVKPVVCPHCKGIGVEPPIKPCDLDTLEELRLADEPRG